jgi:hypothetical protein
MYVSFTMCTALHCPADWSDQSERKRASSGVSRSPSAHTALSGGRRDVITPMSRVRVLGMHDYPRSRSGSPSPSISIVNDKHSPLQLQPVVHALFTIHTFTAAQSSSRPPDALTRTLKKSSSQSDLQRVQNSRHRRTRSANDPYVLAARARRSPSANAPSAYVKSSRASAQSSVAEDPVVHDYDSDFPEGEF